MNSRSTDFLSSSKPKRGGWLVWAIGIVAVLAVLGAAAGFILWNSAPTFVTNRFLQLAEKFGFENVSINVSVVGLERFEAHDLVLEKGGVRVEVACLEASYLPEDLIRGHAQSVTIDGLVISLDFARERKGLLPDALMELTTMFKEKGRSRWPLEELQVRDARLELRFDDTTYPFNVNLTAARNLDERDEFVLDVRHRELRAHAAAELDVETQSGEIELERFRMAPSLLTELAAKLGSYSLPPNSRFDSDRIRASGVLQIHDGTIGEGEGQATIPRLRWSYPGLEGELSSAVISLVHTPGVGVSGEARGDSIVYGTNIAWSAGPLAFDASVEGSELKLQASGFPIAWSDYVEAKVSLSAGAGIPLFGGEPGFRARVIVLEGEVAGNQVEAAALGASGWTDAITVELPELGFRDLPVSFVLGSFSITELESAVPQIQGGVDIMANSGLGRFLPKGFELSRPRGEFRMGRLEIATEENAVSADSLEGTFISQLDEVSVEGEKTSYSWSPDVIFKGTLRENAITANMDATLDRIAIDHDLWPEGLNRASLRADVRDLSVDALLALMKGGAPNQDVSVTSVVSTLGAEVEARSTVEIEYDRETQSWSAKHHFDTENIASCIPRVDATDVKLTADSEWNSIPHAEALGWFEGGEIDPVMSNLIRLARVSATMTASRVAVPEQLSAQWCRLDIKKNPQGADAPRLQLQVDATAGMARAEGRTFTQPGASFVVSGDPGRFQVEGTLGALFEGLDLRGRVKQLVDADWGNRSLSGSGEFSLQPIVLRRSDLLGQWVPNLQDIVVDGTIDVSGNLSWQTSGEWGGSANVVFSDGSAEYLPQRLRAEGVAGEIAFNALPQISSAPGQVFTIERIGVGDLQMTDAMVRFGIHSNDSITVEEARGSIFDGEISVGEFTITGSMPDLVADVTMDRLDLEQIGEFIKPFHGKMTGRLDGHVPVGLLAGEVVLGEGFLELDEGTPATFSYPATGVFTANLTANSLTDQVNRLPYELLEEGLQSVDLDRLRVDLFRRNFPETPIRIDLSGQSETERATVPFEIVTNVNGTVAQVLNLFLRLATL